MRKWTLILFCLSVFFLGFVGATDSSCLEANQNFYGKKLCTLTVESSIDVEVGNNNYELSLISLDENEARIKVLNKDEEGGAKNPWEWTILEGEVNEYVDLIVKNEQTNSDNVEISIITSNCIQNECIFFHFHSVNIPEGNKIWAGFYDENEPTIGVDQESELFVQGEKKEVGNLEIILNKIEDYGYDYDYFTGEPSTAIKNIIISYSEIESIPEEEDIVETEEEGEEIEGCQNSDGNDVYIKGFVIDKYGNKEYDSCLSDERVVEGQCSNSGTYASIYIDCPSDYICEDGCCVSISRSRECKDSDGDNIYTRGFVLNGNGEQNDDFCFEGQIAELVCIGETPGINYLDCPEGYLCQDGACILENPNYNQLEENSEKRGFLKNILNWFKRVF